MELEYASPRVSKERREWRVIVLKAAAAYFLVSLLTFPIWNQFWLGEVPPLGLVQVPKAELRDTLNRSVVMPAIQRLGYSRGSFSPDWSLGKPYALALAYVLPLTVLLAVVMLRGWRSAPTRRWAAIVVGLAALDFCMMSFWPQGQGARI